MCAKEEKEFDRRGVVAAANSDPPLGDRSRPLTLIRTSTKICLPFRLVTIPTRGWEIISLRRKHESMRVVRLKALC